MKLNTHAESYDELYSQFRWNVPRLFNIARNCCRRWAEDRSRLALCHEDESGKTSSWSFWDIQMESNRLSNSLRALGVQPHDRVAIVLPQRPETAIAHMALYQMGAIAVPLSHLFGADALQYRLENSDTRVAIVDQSTLSKLMCIQSQLPQLRHVICVDAATGVVGESSLHAWNDLLSKASRRFECVNTRSDEPAMIIYTSGTTGNPKGALMAHRTLLGNLPGFICSHEFFPLRGDMFWSPADWAWTGGLFDALLPTWYFGMPLLSYGGRFDPEKALMLMDKYGIRNTFLFPTALKMMMKAIPDPRRSHDLRLRTIMSGGEALGEVTFNWARETLGVTINEIFGQTEINYVVGGCSSVYRAKCGSMGRPYPGHRVAILDDSGRPLPPGESGEVCVNRCHHGQQDPVFFLEYWKNADAGKEKFFEGSLSDGNSAWGRTGDLAIMDEDGYLWFQGRRDDVFKSAGYRISPSEIEQCLVQHPAVANAAIIGVPDEERGAVVKAYIVLQAGYNATPEVKLSLQQHVRGKLAPYAYPKSFEVVDCLPMTTTGKVQRGVLRSREEKARGARLALENEAVTSEVG